MNHIKVTFMIYCVWRLKREVIGNFSMIKQLFLSVELRCHKDCMVFLSDCLTKFSLCMKFRTLKQQETAVCFVKI